MFHHVFIHCAGSCLFILLLCLLLISNRLAFLQSAPIPIRRPDWSVCLRDEALAPAGAFICGAAVSSYDVCDGDGVEENGSQGCEAGGETWRSGHHLHSAGQVRRIVALPTDCFGCEVVSILRWVGQVILSLLPPWLRIVASLIHDTPPSWLQCSHSLRKVPD